MVSAAGAAPPAAIVISRLVTFVNCGTGSDAMTDQILKLQRLLEDDRLANARALGGTPLTDGRGDSEHDAGQEVAVLNDKISEYERQVHEAARSLEELLDKYEGLEREHAEALAQCRSLQEERRAVEERLHISRARHASVVDNMQRQIGELKDEVALLHGVTVNAKTHNDTESAKSAAQRGAHHLTEKEHDADYACESAANPGSGCEPTGELPMTEKQHVSEYLDESTGEFPMTKKEHDVDYVCQSTAETPTKKEHEVDYVCQSTVETQTKKEHDVDYVCQSTVGTLTKKEHDVDYVCQSNVETLSTEKLRPRVGCEAHPESPIRWQGWQCSLCCYLNPPSTWPCEGCNGKGKGEKKGKATRRGKG